jgi:hypothetical protein
MPANEQQIVSEIGEFYRGYIDGFNREDIDLFMQSFDLPFAILTGDRPAIICATEADQQRFYAQTMASIQARGWARSGVDQSRVWPLAENLATLMADVTRYRRDDSIIERLRAFYTLRREARSWKIVSLAQATPPFLGPGAIAYPE